MDPAIRNSDLKYPGFYPVTTFGYKFPIDEIIRPYLQRFSPVTMVSYFYAQDIDKKKGSLFIDSGGYASLFADRVIYPLNNGTYGIQNKDGMLIDPESVLKMQEKYAVIGATLDFVVTKEMNLPESIERQNQTIANAKWAVKNKQNPALRLFASLQAWDRASMAHICETLLPLPFDGFALGGMISKMHTPDDIHELITTFREMEGERPLHLFGIGNPKLVKGFYKYGVSSVDSSNYVRQAISKRYLVPDEGTYVALKEIGQDPSLICDCAICRQFTTEYLALDGELNNMALALHNLSATFNYLQIGI